MITPEKASNLHSSRDNFHSLRSFMAAVSCRNYLAPNDWTPLPAHLLAFHISTWLQTT